MSLFGATPDLKAATSKTAPLAERMRPRTLDDFVGQEHLLGPGKPLRVQIERDDATSMIFWGPPGVGKTTLAKIIAETTRASFIEFSAVLSGIKEIKQVMADAEKAAGLWLAHHPVCRRDPSLQQGAAGRFPALCRARRHPADRRNHRKPFLRDHLRAALPLPRLYAATR